METVNLIFSNFLGALTPQINVALTIGVIAGIIGSSIGLVFMFWGVRYLAKAILMGAFDGKLDVNPSSNPKYHTGESDWMNGLSRKEFDRIMELREIESGF